MTTFIRGNDKGFMLLSSVICMFILFLLLVTALELEFRRYTRVRSEYEHTITTFESIQE